MKKWLTIDDIVCSFLSAVAYGFGYSIPAAFDAPGWLCLVICMGLACLQKISQQNLSTANMFRKNHQED